jgi:cell wall-associated NlpC family hydrolase
MMLLGKPYRSGAKGPDAFDCSGLVHYVYKQASIVVPVTAQQLDKAGYEIAGEDVLPADLIVFKIKSAYHVGIMINKKEFIHSSRSKGVSIDSAEQPYWKRGMLGFRRVM